MSSQKWCPYQNILQWQMDRIQKNITLHSSLLFLHPPFFTLKPSTLHSSLFNFQPYSSGRSLTSKKPFLLVFSVIVFCFFRCKKAIAKEEVETVEQNPEYGVNNDDREEAYIVFSYGLLTIFLFVWADTTPWLYIEPKD